MCHLHVKPWFSKMQLQLVTIFRDRARSISEGANIHIFVFSDLESRGFQEKLITQNSNI